MPDNDEQVYDKLEVRIAQITERIDSIRIALEAFKYDTTDKYRMMNELRSMVNDLGNRAISRVEYSEAHEQMQHHHEADINNLRDRIETLTTEIKGLLISDAVRKDNDLNMRQTRQWVVGLAVLCLLSLIGWVITMFDIFGRWSK